MRPKGDLRALFGQELAARLQPEVKLPIRSRRTRSRPAVGEQAGYNLSESLLYLLDRCC